MFSRTFQQEQEEMNSKNYRPKDTLIEKVKALSGTKEGEKEKREEEEEEGECTSLIERVVLLSVHVCVCVQLVSLTKSY
jgi:hypothetical protein